MGQAMNVVGCQMSPSSCKFPELAIFQADMKETEWRIPRGLIPIGSNSGLYLGGRIVWRGWLVGLKRNLKLSTVAD